MESTPLKKKRSVVGRIFAVLGMTLGTFLLVCLLTGLIFGCLFARYVKEDLLLQTDFSMESVTLDQTSVIYYTDPQTGEAVELQRLYGEENRTWVSYKEIPAKLVQACVAIEDHRFWDHQGVDWLRTGWACVQMFLGGDAEFGGSTITQQLIKNLTDEREVTVRRKLVEIFRALEFEKTHTKPEILEWYLNTIYLGQGCYGVQSASRVYFGKDVSELTVAECASLIGITNNPSIYDPYLDPEENRERQLTILWEMYDQGYILTEAEYNAAVAQEMVFVNASGEADEEESQEGGYFSYFVDEVIRDVTRALCEQYGYTEKIADQMVRSGGYSIYCTLNPEIQAVVDRVYQNLDNIPETASAQQLQSGIAVIDNLTGDMVAVAGGVGEKEGSLTFNRATQSLLSPGSTIKPLTVFAPALERGLITPISIYDDTPYSFTDSSRWPKNTDNRYRGLVSVDTAVSQSLNTVAVKVLAELTPQVSFDFARNNMGLNRLVSREVINGRTFTDVDLAPLALGGLTHGVTIQDMATAYASFANNGQYRESRTFTKVMAGDKVILDNEQESLTSVSPKTAWYTTHMLENVVLSGTGTAARLENMDVAGKTGTTTSDFDRWFCGYTPYYTAAVWCGYDVPEEVELTDSTTNPAVYLWQLVMEEVHKDLEYRGFSQPTDVVECWYCADSGLLATDACRSDVRGSRLTKAMLALEDVPTDYCALHTEIDICDESGLAANEYCLQVEANTTHKIGVMEMLRVFPASGIIVQDQQYTYYDSERVPLGYYAAISPTGSTMSDLCTVHTEESVAPEEPEEPDGELVDLDGDGIPDVPDETDVPDTPDTPDTPDIDVPDTPNVPDTPDVPEPDPPIVPEPDDEPIIDWGDFIIW